MQRHVPHTRDVEPPCAPPDIVKVSHHWASAVLDAFCRSSRAWRQQDHRRRTRIWDFRALEAFDVDVRVLLLGFAEDVLEREENGVSVDRDDFGSDFFFFRGLEESADGGFAGEYDARPEDLH